MRSATRTTTLIALCLLLAGLAPVTVAQDEQVDGGAERLLGPEGSCGSVITVQITVEPPTGTDSWVLEETPPQSGRVLQVDGPTDVAEYVEETKSVKWLSMDGSAATVSYTLEIPQDQEGAWGPFVGEYRFHDHMDDRAPVTGADTLDVRCGGSVLRVVPQTAECGARVEVQVSLAPPPATDSWIVDERPPSGLSVVQVDPEDSGAYIEEHHAVRWISKGGDGALKTYQVQVPEDTPDGTEFLFHGEYRLHPGMSARAPIAGDDLLSVSCPTTGDGGGEGPTEDPSEDDPPADGNDTGNPPVPGDGSVPTEDDLVPSKPGAPFVTRFLPASASCGSTLVVTLAVAPAIGTTSWILDEAPPSQVRVEQVDPAHSGEYLSDLHHVKWIALLENRTIITYEVEVPENAAHGSVLVFTGESMAHPVMTHRVDVIGHDRLEVDCPQGGGNNSSGGGGGGGIRTLRMSAPEAAPVEHPVPKVRDPPAGALWQAETGPLTGAAGDRVRLLFEDADGLEVLFTAGSQLERASLTVTAWDSPPEGTAGPPDDFQAVAFLSLELEDGPRTGHEIVISAPSDPDSRGDNAFPVLLEPGPDSWELLGRARDDGDRLVATAPCCSLRAIGYDLADPQAGITLTTDIERGRLYVESVVEDNIGIDWVQLFHNERAVAELSHGEGGYTFDLDSLEEGEHRFRIVAQDLAGRKSEDERTWTASSTQVEEEDDPAEPLFSGWLIPLLLTGTVMLLSLFVATRLQNRRRERAPVASPDLFVTAEPVDLPEGALMARQARVSGQEGSVANVLLDDEEIPTVALLMGETLQNVPLSVTKWGTQDPPIKSLPLPPGADPLVLLETRLPRVKGNHPLLITISLRDDQVLDPERVTLLHRQEDEWRRVDRFLLTLDPDGRYRGTALADQHGVLLIAVTPGDADEDEQEPTDRPPPVPGP